MSASLAPLALAFLVFPIYLIESLLPYSYLVEELFKFLVIYFLISKEKDPEARIRIAFASGVLFSLSESLFYFSLAANTSGINVILNRLLLTTILHSLTITLMTSALKNKVLLFLALAISIIIHYLFNLFILKAF
jgi:hypothetical protein